MDHEDRREEKECCGTCGNNRYEHYGVGEGEFICNCEASDAYACTTHYADYCDEWCKKTNC